MKVRMEKRGC